MKGNASTKSSTKIPLALVQRKVSNLKAARVESGDNCDEELVASKGCFNHFKNERNPHNTN